MLSSAAIEQGSDAKTRLLEFNERLDALNPFFNYRYTVIVKADDSNTVLLFLGGPFDF